MSALLLSLSLAIAASPELVVRFTKGQVTVDAASIETGAEAFAELAYRKTTRLRVFSTTRLLIEGNKLQLITGRVWIQATSGKEALLVEMPGVLVDIGARTSMLAEYTRLSGGTVTVRSGGVQLLTPTEKLAVKAREVAVISPVEDLAVRVRTGGTGLGDLAMREAERGLGDLFGFSKLLLDSARRTQLGSEGLRGANDILRTDAQLSGADSGTGGFLTEGALRPPPFFEEEVPPKGPNVRVEVTFGED